MKKAAYCLGLLLLSAVTAWTTFAADRVERLSSRNATGHIAVRARGRHLPGNAQVSISRTHAKDKKDRIRSGFGKRHHGKNGGRGAAAQQRASATPNVLAMYDISISDGGKKWQPAASEPVQVTIDLAEPVPVQNAASLGVVHLADDGTVEELEASRRGFTFNADKTAVTAFWFDASGFSVYAIVDEVGELVTPRRFYHFYDHPTTVTENGHVSSFTLPYIYHDESNDVVNVQIVKDGDMLKEPPIPPDITNETGEVVSMFEGWYVVSTNMRPADAVESKLDATNEYFHFVWPVGATDMRMSFTNAVQFAKDEDGKLADTADVDYFVVPLYEHARFLQFNENAHAETDHAAAARIIKRKLVAINDETGEAVLKVSDVEAALKNSRQEYFCGWEYLDTDGQYKQLLVYSDHGKPMDQYITVTDALFEANGGAIIQLYPYYVSAHFLRFDSNAEGAKAEYVHALFVRSTSNFKQVEVSSGRKGYDFAGWRAGFYNEATHERELGEQVTDENGNFIPNKSITNPFTGAVAFTTDAQGNIRMNEDVTLFGTWRAKDDAPYRVIIWQQRVTDSKNATDAEKTYYYVTHYTSPVVPASTQIAESMITSFSGTAPRSGETNPENSNLTTVSGSSNLTGKDFTGFHYGRWECSDQTVASDGSTVINIYYDRDLITFQFCVYKNQAQTVYTVTSSTSGTIYGTDDGETYFEVYYNDDDGRWYKTRTSGLGYAYSTQYTGTRYYVSGTNWLGRPEYSTTTSNEGTQYRRTGSFLNYDYHEIFYNEADGKWYENYGQVTVYSYSDPYVGTRYTRSTTNWAADDDHIFTGLYGQTLAFNGYEWLYSDYWYDGHGNNAGSGTRTTFLDSFKENKVYYRAGATTSDNKPVYFYKQTVNGTYEDGEGGQPNNYANTVKVGSNSGFKITDKYSGFKAAQYKEDSGSWKNTTVSSSSSAITEYDSASFTSQLKIRFARNKHRLTYQYTDDDGDHVLRDTGEVVPFEAPLTAYDIAYTNLNWTGCDVSNRTFSGWYEDASLTKKFDFNGTMPDNDKIIYAKWSPLQHKVVLEANGGELPDSQFMWFYVNPEKNETIDECTPTRNYRLDLHNGTFYYHHDVWDPLGDKHVTDTNSPSFIPNISRKVYYTEDFALATSNKYSNPANRYVYDPGAYAFMGWFEVLADGTLATDPFSFGEPPTGPVTLRAIWRRLGVYTLKYESIDPDGEHDPDVIYDPQRHDSGNVEDGYVADAETTLQKAPSNYNKNKWIWEGWQAIDTDNNNIPLTTIRSPGDVYLVKPTHADSHNVIHFRAVYKYIDDGTSRHIPPVTDLILDSNENAGLAAGATIPQRAGSGTYTDGSSVAAGGFNQGVWFAGMQNNFSVNLEEYSDAFAHNNGYFLLGWDPLMHLDSLIPKYTAEQTIGVDKQAGTENALYAIWEPQVYIEFTNATETALNNITLYIPSWIDGEVFRANTAKSKYVREVFSAFANGQATFDLAAGESLRLVLPDGADRDFAVMGTCSYEEGNKLVVTRIEPTVEGQAAIPDVTQSVYPGEEYMVSGTMKVSPTPVQVRFTTTTYETTTDVPVRYFLHDPNGTVTEITHNASYWETQANVKTNLTQIGADVKDIAKLLQKGTTAGVHDYLAPTIREQYGYTTIGVGAATGDFDEWRSITKNDPQGGSYIKFYHEQLEWSRYSQVWSPYDGAAVYVVFYKRIPVHVTVGKTVVGTEEDKDREFSFSTEFTENVEVFEYTVTTRYTATRTATYTRNNTSSGWGNPSTVTAWAWDDGTSTSGPRTSVTPNPEEVSFDARSADAFSLKDGGRHPETIYFSSSDEGDETSAQTTFGSLSQGNTTYYRYTTGNTAGTSSNARRKVVEETTNYSQTVTHRVVYRYETVVVRETSAANLFTLTRIGDDPHHDSDQCSGVKNVGARSYTISSKMETGTTGVYTYTPLDTAIFTNTRKTGELTISKTVVDGDAGDTFPFIVTLGETVVDKDNYTNNFPLADGVHLGPYGKVFSFSLEDNGSVTLRGLPAGASYTVEEVSHAKYVPTLPANASGTIAADTTTSVGVTNTRKSDLTVEMKDKTVIFTGNEQSGYDISEVTGTGSPVDTEGYTVTGLKDGHVLTMQHYVVPRGITVGSYTGHVENVRYTVLEPVANGDPKDVTDEYMFTAKAGALTINPTPIIVTVTGNATNVVYNGEEQSLQGYTYELTHAVTGDVLTNENVFVSILVDYQKAWGKDAGTYNMSIASDNVTVTVPDGMSVSEVVVAAQGRLVIEPKPITVAADDKVKILNRPDPTLTATVTGLCGDDTVAYALSRIAGETPGTYTITAEPGDVASANYTVTYETGTLTIQELDLVQRATGSGKAVDEDVPITDDLLEALGFDPADELSATDVSDVLNRVDPNGLYRWENLVTGTSTNHMLLSTVTMTNHTESTISLVQDEDPQAPIARALGYDVLYDLKRLYNAKDVANREWRRVDGPDTTPSFTVQLIDENGNSLGAAGYYRVHTLIIPMQDLSITNELPSTNIIGVLEVNSPLKNTMTAVPWKALASAPEAAQPVAVQNYVDVGQLEDGDVINALDTDGTYQQWTLVDGVWQKAAATVREVKGMMKTVSTPKAEERELERGEATWVSRNGTEKPYFLVGQYTGENVEIEIAGGEKAVKGSTMITNPTLYPLSINDDIDWGGNPSADDVIQVPNGLGVPQELIWSDGEWGYSAKVYDAKKKRYVKEWRTGFTISPGTGFWYYRTGGAFKITIDVDQID